MSDNNLRIPSQIFRWFEKMKSSYDNNIQAVMTRFEQNNAAQQKRLDTANENHINDLQTNHNQQINLYQSQIDQYQQDIKYFKQQIADQQQTIQQLNSRYDAVMACMINEKNNSTDIKDIFETTEFFSENEKDVIAGTENAARQITQPREIDREDNKSNEIDNSAENTKLDETIEASDGAINVSQKFEKEIISKTATDLADSIKENSTLSETITEAIISEKETLNSQTETALENNETLYQQAMTFRNNQEFKAAYELFLQAAKASHVKAMGALGRCYFLGEGVEPDHVKGLVWLIGAAELGLTQAISRVEHFKQNDPELYQLAISSQSLSQ